MKKSEKSEKVLFKTRADLGEALFFDKNLSKNRTQACATCHDSKQAFVDKRNNSLMLELKQAVSLGDDNKSIGNRNTPTINYASLTPSFKYSSSDAIGGMFHDGRAKDLKEQAGMPLLNPVEMNMSSKNEVISRIKENENYIKSFEKIFSKNIFNNDEDAYEALTIALASFERTKIFNSFDSKYDLYLEGKYELNEKERRGRDLFFSNEKTNCASCHLINNSLTLNTKETFTSYKYFNIGIPKNILVHNKRVVLGLENEDAIDNGLFENKDILVDDQKGKFKVPTLRNIAITSPYMHNGVFQKLDTVLKFYEFTRDNNLYKINPETNKVWEKAEVEENIDNVHLLSGKELDQEKINALITFLKLLTDKQYEHLLEGKK
ncbi:MAG: methylamine utilization protein MauG [Campylobacteraceae bacterium]|nr:methylamine utilization protein MauG [Campylobacteraceae bacterium]